MPNAPTPQAKPRSELDHAWWCDVVPCTCGATEFLPPRTTLPAAPPTLPSDTPADAPELARYLASTRGEWRSALAVAVLLAFEVSR